MQIYIRLDIEGAMQRLIKTILEWDVIARYVRENSCSVIAWGLSGFVF